MRSVRRRVPRVARGEGRRGSSRDWHSTPPSLLRTNTSIEGVTDTEQIRVTYGSGRLPAPARAGSAHSPRRPRSAQPSPCPAPDSPRRSPTPCPALQGAPLRRPGRAGRPRCPPGVGSRTPHGLGSAHPSPPAAPAPHAAARINGPTARPSPAEPLRARRTSRRRHRTGTSAAPRELEAGPPRIRTGRPAVLRQWRRAGPVQSDQSARSAPKLKKISRYAIPVCGRRAGDIIREAPVGPAQRMFCHPQPSSTGTQESGTTAEHTPPSPGEPRCRWGWLRGFLWQRPFSRFSNGADFGALSPPCGTSGAAGPGHGAGRGGGGPGASAPAPRALPAAGGEHGGPGPTCGGGGADGTARRWREPGTAVRGEERSLGSAVTWPPPPSPRVPRHGAAGTR
ncbi:PREDICTED: translation initiation factor IF-2-like [Sturnus vulgaris]|uniref:translation initiation factor IF-2-like n=1 Tax=Sturnus vulgaris TaxID=9172 RepID=UPI000719F79B|nr:PREDICTED: translation initiation factor IF-2-like [Sturnus vulgaris]